MPVDRLSSMLILEREKEKKEKKKTKTKTPLLLLIKKMNFLELLILFLGIFYLPLMGSVKCD